MPRAVALRLPKLGMAMTEATFVEWLVEDGAAVTDGQALYVVETDKVETEVPALTGGTLHRNAEPGQVYRIGDEVGSIDVPD